jgi:hypothetical protein
VSREKAAMLVYAFIFLLFCILFFIAAGPAFYNAVAAFSFLAALFMASVALKEEE